MFYNTGEADQTNNNENGKKFSYIGELSEEELRKYESFANDKDIEHLKDFSPEKITLVYFHSAVIDDIEATYALTYDGGLLPDDFSTFKSKYYENVMKFNSEKALEFRYYDSIDIYKGDSENSDELRVDMRVSYGYFTASLIQGKKGRRNLENGYPSFIKIPVG
ncbi:hypothetical protein LGQ02_10170 [Bacillus shivajii]|uniref:hypothetical protein n=1 Tax=Bacillus shivajii TaxID=1983719 RepID=UPI001CFC0CA2|nr:hypothetical protein [Bacillus shivajii]UCZ55058.1 hypothetical protein LGQ02_10170 [Bacillus shivajii]